MAHGKLQGRPETTKLVGVEEDYHDIAVLHFVGSAFDPLPAGLGHGGLAAQLDQVITADDLHTDEALFHVRVNLAADCPIHRLWPQRYTLDRPQQCPSASSV